MSNRPLEGIKVVELGTHFAVPAVARMMADWGAEVVKVEGLKGDAWRTVGRNQMCPILDEENPFFCVPNANKEFIALNLKEAEGKEALMKLISEADVFMTNMRLGAVTKLGFSYDQLKEEFPGLIYAHFTGFGYEGPDAARPGFDSVAFWARSGAMLDWNAKDSYPFLAPTGAGDAMTASILCAGVLAAVIGKAKTGKGTFVSSSLMGSAIWYNNAGVVSTQYGNEFPKDKNRPSNPLGWQYQCADGEWIMLGVLDYTDAYRKIMPMMGNEHLLEDTRFNTVGEARKHVDELMPILRAGFMQDTADNWVKRIGAVNIVLGKIGHLKDLPYDEQAIANKFIVPVTFPSGNTVRMPTVPVMFSNYDVGDAYIPNGPVGCDDDKVLARIGYTTEQIAAMKEKGVTK